jgi:DNA-binding transcriptional ArsR family regulator
MPAHHRTPDADPQRVWDCLSHPARRRIIDLLRQEPATTGALHDRLEAEHLSPSRFATHRHLQALRDARLVLVTPRGRERLNFLNGSALYEATIGWLDPPARAVAGSLHRLADVAESPSPRPSPEQTMTEIRHLSVHQSLDIAAPAGRVWEILTTRSREWWQPPFTLLGGDQETELRIPEAPGESVVEVAGERSAAWGMLVAREENRYLEWTSIVCGAAAATGSVRVDLEPASDGDATTLTFRQDAIGVLDEQTDADVALGWSTKLEAIAALLG